MKKLLLKINLIISLLLLSAVSMAWESDFHERSYNDRCEDLDSTFITNVGTCRIEYNHDPYDTDLPASYKYCFTVTYKQLEKSYDSFTNPNGRTITWSNRTANHWTKDYCTDSVEVYSHEAPALARFCKNSRQDAIALKKSSNSRSGRRASCE